MYYTQNYNKNYFRNYSTITGSDANVNEADRYSFGTPSGSNNNNDGGMMNKNSNALVHMNNNSSNTFDVEQIQRELVNIWAHSHVENQQFNIN